MKITYRKLSYYNNKWNIEFNKVETENLCEGPTEDKREVI